MFLIVLLCRFLLESDNLPDYHAYMTIYTDPSSYSKWNIAFTTLAIVMSNLTSYEVFRFMIYLSGFALFIFALKKNYIKNNFLIFAILVLVLLEFYMVRMRAGISIVFFYLGYALYLKNHKFISTLFFSLSLLFHTATGLVFFVLYLPFLLKIKFEKLFLIILFSVWILLFYVLDTIAINRGAHLSSAINPVRVIFLIMIPTVLICTLKKLKIGSLTMSQKPELIGLILASVALLLMYLVGFFQESGEAIIRAYSLIASPALLFGYLIRSNVWTRTEQKWAQLVLLVNSLFFINTVFIS
jgi:hypothetical protein